MDREGRGQRAVEPQVAATDDGEDSDEDDEEEDEEEEWGESIGNGWYLIQEEGEPCYFWHEPTDRSQWDHPLLTKQPAASQASRETTAARAAKEESSDEDDDDDGDDSSVEGEVDWRKSLGDGWYEIAPDEEGEPPYYWHEPSDRTQWQRP